MSHQRRTHRKRISVSRLSSDTVITLPEYTSPLWHRQRNSVDDTPSDRPPDYPDTDSAEEADEDTDDSDNGNTIGQTFYVPPPPQLLPVSPRRQRRFISHRRQFASTSRVDPLDTLLERSVHALEMSNVLLQTSMSTQSSLSTLLNPDSPRDLSMEESARGLTMRIRGSRTAHENWMEDLAEITKGVEGLISDEHQTPNDLRPAESSVSRSLPTSSLPHLAKRNIRRPSLEFRSTTNDLPALRLSNLERSILVSPPPRALTQYVESTADPNAISLPSTLGLRASSSSHPSDNAESSSSNIRSGFHAAATLPVLTDRPSEPSTPAYNLLSSFVTRAPSSGSSTPSSSMTTSFLASFSPSRRGSGSTEREWNHAVPRASQKSPDRRPFGQRGSSSRSRSLTPKRPGSPPPPVRRMTPPIEELSASSSSSDSPNVQRTVQSLRKILNDQPSPESANGNASKAPSRERLRAPAFMPRSPAPAPTSDTSTATASVSRLFTKGTHSSSARPSSPPKQSALKRSQPTTPIEPPTPSSSTLSIPDMFARAMGSAPSSGRSTPKRISFAELPESYSGTRPPGSASRFKEKRRKSLERKGERARHRRDWSGDEASGGWLTSWLMGGAGTSSGPGHGVVAVREDKVEDRINRGWGGRTGMGMGVLDEWAV